MKLVDFSTSRRVTVAMLMIAIVAFGMVGFSRLALNLLPDITYPTITIRTNYPGVAPLEMERLISEPVEGLVGVVSNVVRVSSVSRPGASDVVVEFGWGTNMDFASMDVREKLDLANLPREAGQPVLLRFDPGLDPVMRLAFYGELSLLELRRIAEEYLRPDLESLAGVAAVRIEGGLEEEIQVEVETRLLTQLGLSIGQVTSRLAAENVNLTGGTLKDGEAEFLVRTLNEFQTIEEIGEIIVGQIDRAPIKLKDVARVFRGHRERDLVTRINGREGVEVAVFKEGDANTVQVSRALQERIDVFLADNGQLLGESQLEVVFNQATFIEQAVDEVLNTAMLGGVLAVVVLFLFLRDFKSTAIISLAIPLSVVATFFLMFAADVSLNIMSLGGLALGVGMLVDNSIVVLESVQRYRDQGMPALEAARRGSGEVGQAVVAATLTTICVFLPIVFVEGVAGQLFRDQALTVTFSLVASLIVALMLIPMLSSLSLATTEGERKTGGGTAVAARVAGAGVWLVGLVSLLLGWLLKPFTWTFELLFGLLNKVYPPVLGWALRHRLVVLLLALVLAGGVLERASHLGVELIPEMSQGEFLVDLEWTAGTPLEQTASQVGRLDRQIGDMGGVASVFAVVGTAGQAGGTAGEKKEHTAQLHIKLDPLQPDEVAAMEAVRALLADVPDLAYKFSRPSYFSFRTPVEVEIIGFNLSRLEVLADDVVERLRGIEGLTDIRASTQGGQPEIQVVFDRLRLAELGTTPDQIGSLLRNKLQGDIATELARRDRKIDIRVRARSQDRRTLEDLKRMVVSPASYPQPVTLESVARVQLVDGPAEIRRREQERVAVVSANLVGRDLGSVVQDIEREVEQIPLPEGFAIAIGGQNEEMARSFDSMKFALALAVFLVYLVMASQFESFLHPLVIMCTIPLGLVGSALGLIATGQTISVVVLIGLIMLAGIVVNNAIVLVDFINHLRREEGLAKMAAVLRAGTVRFRPILMTTSTTVLGLLPMALGLGEGAEIRAPMATTVIGGLLVSTALTLVLVPVVYTLMDRGD
ncbi:MAG: AcrB/AcrD/AcrF family protein [Candidatus Latescibacteria bacterium]|nr:AcrB/AcrD/AcrF family protein [Candidatus Latescibacterota bacterium]